MAKANAASVAIVKDGRVLLVRRAREPFAGRWTLPGGRCEPGETPEQTAVREVREELGLLVGVAPLTRVETGPWRLAVFTGTGTGAIVPSDEVSAYRWASIAAAEGLETTPGLIEVLQLVPGLT